jgi:hypothetical protein
MKESRIFPIFKHHCREGLWKIGSCPPFSPQTQQIWR